MKTRTMLIIGAVLLVATAQRVHAQRPADSSKNESTIDSTRIRVTHEAARQIARSRVPGGEVQGDETKAERGMLIYYFTVRGSDGSVQQVQVNAMTGEITKGRPKKP